MKKNIIRGTIIAFALAGIMTLGSTKSEAALGDITLSMGMRHTDVTELQQGLKKLGYYNSSIDIIFGSGTKSAVVKYQKAKSLSADGVVGSATAKSIKSALGTSSVSNSSASTATKVVNTAKRYVGHKYVFGGVGPSGFDCSGFTQYVYKQTGISIPRTTRSQATVGKGLSKPQVSSGDLIVFSDTYQPGPSHVGICIGNGNFVHAANAQKGVRTDSLNSTYYNSKFTSGRRLF